MLDVGYLPFVSLSWPAAPSHGRLGIFAISAGFENAKQARVLAVFSCSKMSHAPRTNFPVCLPYAVNPCLRFCDLVQQVVDYSKGV
jgi:hypothetical protein